MMIKILAMGMTPAIWKNVFHHFRTQLKEVHFSAGIFTTPEELAYLRDEYFSTLRPGDLPDYLLCGAPPSGQAAAQLKFLESLQSRAGLNVCSLVLTLPTLEHGLRGLVQGTAPVRLHLDNDVAITLRDPALILKNFPADFPRMQVDAYLSAIRLRERNTTIKPGQLREEHLLGFNEIAAVEQGEQVLPPEDWLRQVLKAEKVKLPPDTPLGLMRDGRGIFIFPGVPLGRIRSVAVGGVHFAHLIDLGVMTGRSPQLKSLTDALARSAAQHTRWLEEVTQRLRHAEARRDFPLVCEALQPILAQSMAALLTQRGFRRVAVAGQESMANGAEPSLVLHLSAIGGKSRTRGRRHLVLDISEELAEQFLVLDELLDWGSLTLEQPIASSAQISGEDFRSRCGRLAGRTEKARAGLNLALNRGRLLEQERVVLHTACDKLTDLLEARDTLQIWSGELSPEANQVLVFSHDQEEAGAVLQALPHIAKKRWFDLSSYNSADALQNLSLDDLGQYRDDGMMVITVASRDRLGKLREQIGQSLEETESQIEENGQALAFFRDESEKIEEANRQLARQWINTTLTGWLDNNPEVLMGALEDLRKRNEREWFHRPSVRKVVIVSADGQNRRALAEACNDVFSGFDPEKSVQFPYDLETQQDLSPIERDALLTRAEEEELDAKAVQERLRSALEAHNRENMERYLEVLLAELKDVQADLLVVEHELPVATQVLEALRREGSTFRDTPAICILPAYWAPPEDQPLPWARTRMVVIRRLGALTSADCSGPIRALYAV